MHRASTRDNKRQPRCVASRRAPATERARSQQGPIAIHDQSPSIRGVRLVRDRWIFEDHFHKCSHHLSAITFIQIFGVRKELIYSTDTGNSARASLGVGAFSHHSVTCVRDSHSRRVGRSCSSIGRNSRVTPCLRLHSAPGRGRDARLAASGQESRRGELAG